MSRPLTSRQKFVLQHLGEGYELRRRPGGRAFLLFHAGTDVALSYDRGVNCNEVLLLASRGGIEAFNPATSEALGRVSPYTKDAIGYRLNKGAA